MRKLAVRPSAHSRSLGHSRVYYLAVALALGAILFTSRFVKPSDLPSVVCVPKEVAGLPCLTTGLTRSFHATANGQLSDAVGFHPVGPFFFALTALLFVLACARLTGFKRRVFPFQEPGRVLFYGSLLVLGLWWAVRVMGLADW